MRVGIANVTAFLSALAVTLRVSSLDLSIPLGQNQQPDTFATDPDGHGVQPHQWLVAQCLAIRPTHYDRH